MDSNAARASRHGVSTDKIMALENYASSDLFNEAEQVALEWADAMTHSDLDTTDELFQRLAQQFSDDEIVELTAIIALENFRSKFNHAMRVPSSGLWKG